MKLHLSSVLPMAAVTLAVAQQTFSNPVLWQDLADLEVIRVNDTYYYTASTMHYSPGAPVLKSYNLVDWEFVGNSVPELIFGDEYYLNGTSRAYVGGIWASSLQYRESNGLFYWYGCIQSGEMKTWIFTASDPAGPWTAQPPIDECFYDLGVLVDDDDTMYVAYGRYNISVAQLSPDGLKPVRNEVVWVDPVRYLEGARFYHIGSSYYIWLTKPADGQHVLKADSPWGPYTDRTVLDRMASPIPHSGTPHQGGIVDTPDGDWWYMSFLDAYPSGRIPVLAPLTWDEEGWPHIVTDEAGGWGKTYPMPVQTDKTVDAAGEYTDSFAGPGLSPEWAFNHNPDNSAWELGAGGLTLRTATVTDDLYSARNTLAHRILGPKSSGTFRLNVGNMADGDVAGVSIFRDESAYIGLRKEGGSLKLVAVHDVLAPESAGWQTTSNGTVVATASGCSIDLSGAADGTSDIYLRIVADLHPTFGVEAHNPAQLLYSTDGENFTQLGPDYWCHNRWQYFLAFRFAVFNYATKSLGGSVLVKEFTLELVE
ncbi:glycosyl hydrolase family 43 [Colletotrichum higginsianum IMI 349063]|uniref:Glycosyl hydrolase family 43 n=2 Tax=Colletotrichum higginsianum TaxID=80884 RepID=A0A1B7YSV0_COLHI|nr:glycosyl hydrolase family 43 [Colletotrichum higginsianum IMI 349063]OBR15042.1 glycosyl hydrolase family 43 [Colletotrichum higginsianum IMI 349063]TID03889.1 putative beta-xylosidase [Colletotrichum higginsianum]